MITVRYPNGQAIQYANGVQCSHDFYGTRIWDSADKDSRRLLAIVQDSAGAIIEFSYPTRVCNPLTEQSNQKLEDLAREIRSLKRKIAKLKE